MFDKDGIALIDCQRGTNKVEAIHKTLMSMCGEWNTGIEMGDCLLTERRHRFNHKNAERTRRDFPRLGHYDTWLIDRLQWLVMENHGDLLFPTWSNTCDYIDTEESFGTVNLAHDDLRAAIQTIEVTDDVVRKLQPNQKYMCRKMCLKLPVQPVITEEEMMLFHQLIRNQSGTINFDEMAVEWCKHVDGIRIFPKLPGIQVTAPSQVSYLRIGLHLTRVLGFYVCFVQCTLEHIMKNGDATRRSKMPPVNWSRTYECSRR